MINQIENCISRSVSFEEANEVLNPREKLQAFLPKFPPVNRNLLENFINLKDDKDGSFLINDKAISELLGLIEPNAKNIQEELAQRQSVERVNMGEILDTFSYKEKLIIVKNLGMWQMTDGCTVGCPWCGVRSKRKIERAFSYNSTKDFWEKYGKHISKNKEITLYHRSDPFDWISEDGVHDYTDLADLVLENINNSKLFTSTAIPKGSELSVINYLMLLYSKSEKTGKEINGKVEMRLNNFDGFRFSQSNNNRERVNKIFQILKMMGIPESFPKSIIDVIDREGKEDHNGAIGKKAKNIGYFVGHPDRDEYGPDMLGLSNHDWLIISPSGVTSESVEIVTMDSPEGLRVTNLVSGKLEIPEYVKITDYERILDDNNNLFPLLPKFRYKTYNKDGKFTGTKVVESVRRDALAFCLTVDNMGEMVAIFTSKKAKEEHPEWIPQAIKDIKENFIPKYEERKKSCLRLFSQERDEQAIRITTRLIGEIDNWLANMDEKLGISELKNKA